MVQKRPFNENESVEVSSKQSRQVESEEHTLSVLEFPYKSSVQSSHSSGWKGYGDDDNCSAKMKPGYDEMFDFAIAEPLSFPIKDLGSKGSSYLPLLSRVTSSTREEGIRPESPFQIMSSPDYNNIERLPRSHVHHAEIFSFLLDNPPRKAFAVGLDFQANIPEWVGRGVHKTFICSTNERSILPSKSLQSISSELFDSEKEPGHCVVPMPETILPVDSGEVGFDRGVCTCVDMGSMRCVRQHILEAREKLRRTVGNEAFAELGFCEMGEVVAEKWSREEEQLFHDVVFSYQASSGMNFWEHLAVDFAHRSKKEIVSYYFNVFMLRKRGQQNRCQSMNIDSDDDEWQGPDDSSDNDEEVDEDSLVVDCDRLVTFDEGICTSDKEVCQTVGVDYHSVDCGGHNINVLETNPRGELVKGSSDIIIHLSCAGHSPEAPGSDVKNDLPASDDADIAVRTNMERSTDDYKHWSGHYSGSNSAGGHDFMLEACNSKEWDVGYSSCPRNEIDLLPTCSMIEEVFGAGSWNCKGRDGRGLS